MPMTDKERFMAIRKRVFNMIAKALSVDSMCKSYEGCIEVSVEYPDYFDDEKAEQSASQYVITLHCYVLGPGRHYSFRGKTFHDALNEFERTIADWERDYAYGTE